MPGRSIFSTRIPTGSRYQRLLAPYVLCDSRAAASAEGQLALGSPSTNPASHVRASIARNVNQTTVAPTNRGVSDIRCKNSCRHRRIPLCLVRTHPTFSARKIATNGARSLKTEGWPALVAKICIGRSEVRNPLSVKNVNQMTTPFQNGGLSCVGCKNSHPPGADSGSQRCGRDLQVSAAGESCRITPRAVAHGVGGTAIGAHATERAGITDSRGRARSPIQRSQQRVPLRCAREPK